MMRYMGPVDRTSFVQRSPSSKIPIALLLNVALLAGAAFALYRFRQAWLTSKVFFPVTIASSSVGVVALAALNCAIWRSKRVNPAEVEAAQPVLPPHDGGNPTLQPVAEQSDPFDSLSDDLILEIIKYFSPKDLSRLMRVNRRFCRISKDPFLWRPLLDREWMGPYPARLDQGGDTVYRNYCRLQLLAKQGRLPDIMSETVLKGHISKVLCLAVTPDGKNIISGSDSEDQAVRIWDIASGQQLARLSGHTGGVSCVVVTPNGKNIISCSWDNTIRVWDIARRQQLAHLSGHTGGVTCVAVTPNGKNIISGSWDNTIRVWDIESGQQLACLSGHTGGVSCVAVTPNGKNIISGSWDNTIRVWDIASGQQLACLVGRTDGPVRSLAVTPNGGKIISPGSFVRGIRVWDIGSGQEIARLPEHLHNTGCVAVTPDGKIILGYYERVRVLGYNAEKFAQIEP